METKKVIRNRVLKERKALSKEERYEMSQRIAEKVTTHPFFAEADVIFLYADYNGEVETEGIAKKARKAGKQVAVPRVAGDVMEFYGVVSAENLEPGCMGILEPKNNCPSMEHLSPEVKVLVIMPGAVFDKYRHRIGYGGGYYDKYLSNHPKYDTMAIAYDFQVLDEIPSESFDVKPDVILTESCTYE